MENKAKISKSTTMENPNRAYPANVNYPPGEDIYSMGKETEIDPEDTSKIKSPVDNGKFNEKNFNQDKSGSDLDIPGSELDDEQENIGSEDEENNGYSIGSDNHNDLEEDDSEKQ
ncbi:hypothetical protein [Flavobacterium wongokense]|uniref:hypothetical protein n=1 Tax=Flavobacterium wongokense TaxID=2910674 RepID=UPI001F382B9F|nr:hypothetical protein [Flavobacterium sp. WG47]MCF6133292.1 hypothetical protein [Flavobacterium sp. WG47]